MRRWIGVFAVVSLAGCTWLTAPKEQPVQQDYAGSFFGDKRTNVFSMTPERRTVIVVLDHRLPAKPTDQVEARFWAEPAPDAAENLASTFKAAFEASIKPPAGQGPEATVAAAAARGFASQISQLFKRSQGIQLFRDGVYTLCQAYLNGIIDDKYYQQQFVMLLNGSIQLALAELLVGRAEEPAATPSLDSMRKQIEELQKMVEALKPEPAKPPGTE